MAHNPIEPIIEPVISKIQEDLVSHLMAGESLKIEYTINIWRGKIQSYDVQNTKSVYLCKKGRDGKEY